MPADLPHDPFYITVSNTTSSTTHPTPCTCATEKSATTHFSDNHLGALAIATVVATPLILAGCGNSGGDQASNTGGGGETGVDNSPTLTFTAFDIRVSTDSSTAAITVNDRTQLPAPATEALVFPLDGVMLATDPGKKAATTAFTLLAHVAGGTTDKLYTITINPGLSTIRGHIGSATFDQAKHLAVRTGFGASLDDILALAGMNYNQAVDHMVDNMSTKPIQPDPSWHNTVINVDKWRYWRGLRMWWMQEIIQTPTPFTERMVAFWGNHFVINFEEIIQPRISWSWQNLLRTHASGNLRTFVHEMCLHPAMLIYLDNRYNVKTRPPGAPKTDPANLPSNENFGRELLELFLLGEGQLYTEDDVIETARAFTGHNLDGNLNYIFYAHLHDSSPDITILGVGPKQFGSSAGNVYDVIDAIFAAKAVGDDVPRVARFIVEKLWNEFIGTVPTAAEVHGLAVVLYNNNWELKPLYKALFKHSAFKNLSAARKMIKMPIEYICGFYRSLGVLPFNNRWDIRVDDCNEEDQHLFAPPIVKGWLGGKTWVDSKTLLQRFIHMTSYGGQLTDIQLPRSLRNDYELLLLNASRAFPAPTPASNDKNPFSTLLRALVRDPSYHIK